MKEYEYRVTAINDGGESEPSEGSRPIKAKKLKDAPKVSVLELLCPISDCLKFKSMIFLKLCVLSNLSKMLSESHYQGYTLDRNRRSRKLNLHIERHSCHKIDTRAWYHFAQLKKTFL